MNRRILGLLVVGLLIGPIAAKAQIYTVTELGSTGSGSTDSAGYGNGATGFPVGAINNSGQVVGTAQSADYPMGGSVQAIIWNGATPTSLGNPSGGTGSFANAINNSGQVVGISDANGIVYATIWNGGTPTLLGTLGSTANDAAVGINNAGVVVGESNGYAAVWRGTTPTALPSLWGQGTNTAYAINDSGMIVGLSESATDTGEHAVLWQGSTIKDLGTLGGNYSQAIGVNNAGQIVGIASAVNNGPYQAFLYSNGTMTALASLGGTTAYSVAGGIDAAGQIVGQTSTSSGRLDATLWTGTTALDLNTLVSGELPSNYYLTDATAISANGNILAEGTNTQTGQESLFVLSPHTTPEIDPASAASGLTLLLGGLAMLRGRRVSQAKRI